MITFDACDGEPIRLLPIVMTVPGKDGKGPVVAVGESEESLSAQNEDLVASGKLPGPLRFVRPGESKWWDALQREADWRKGAGSSHLVPQHEENVLYVISPLEKETWSRRYIDAMLNYAIYRSLPRWEVFFQILRPALDLEIAVSVPEEERRFIERVVRSQWVAPVRTGPSLPSGYRLGELVVRFGVLAMLLGSVLALWCLRTIYLPSDLWRLRTLWIVGVPIVVVVSFISWWTRHFFTEGLGQTPWQFVGKSLSALGIALFFGIPIAISINSIKSVGTMVYEGRLIEPIGTCQHGRRKLTLEDEQRRVFDLTLPCHETNTLVLGSRIRREYQRGWLGIPFGKSGRGPDFN